MFFLLCFYRGANLQPAAPGEGSVESNDDIDGDVLVASEVFGKDVVRN